MKLYLRRQSCLSENEIGRAPQFMPLRLEILALEGFRLIYAQVLILRTLA